MQIEYSNEKNNEINVIKIIENVIIKQYFSVKTFVVWNEWQKLIFLLNQFRGSIEAPTKKS